MLPIASRNFLSRISKCFELVSRTASDLTASNDARYATFVEHAMQMPKSNIAIFSRVTSPLLTSFSTSLNAIGWLSFSLRSRWWIRKQGLVRWVCVRPCTDFKTIHQSICSPCLCLFVCCHNVNWPRAEMSISVNPSSELSFLTFPFLCCRSPPTRLQILKTNSLAEHRPQLQLRHQSQHRVQTMTAAIAPMKTTRTAAVRMKRKMSLRTCDAAMSMEADLGQRIMGAKEAFSLQLMGCSGVMARLVWARNQPIGSRCILACLDRMLR